MPSWFKLVILGLLSVLLLACEAAQSSGSNATDEIHYLGRYDLTEAGDHRMGWPGSGFNLRFRGTKLTVTITDDGDGIMDAVINGKSSALILRAGMQDYTIVTSDTESLFDVSLTRRTEVFDTGLFVLNDIRVEGELIARPLPERKILFIGDSITAGYGVRGNTKDCQYTPASNAPQKSYAWLATNALEAEAQLVAISGRGVVYNYDNNPAPVMPAQLDYAVPDEISTWDHNKFRADVVVVTLGTNDWSVINPGEDKFRAGYTSLLNDIRARFPDAHIVTAAGPLLSGDQGAAIRNGVNYAMEQLNDAKISTLDLTLSETQLKWSCSGHPGRDSMVKMANELSAHISRLTRWNAKTSAMPHDLRITPPDDMKDAGKKHYRKRVQAIAQHAPLDGGVLFLGDSITEAGNWAEFFPLMETANHGVGWDTVGGVGGRLPQITLNNPDKIFIKIGTNDIDYDHDPVDMAAELEDVITVLKFKRPNARLYLQSILPREVSNVAKVKAINAEYSKLAADIKIPFIDLTAVFSAPDGSLRSALTDDNVHLNAEGYKVWVDAIRSFVTE